MFNPYDSSFNPQFLGELYNDANSANIFFVNPMPVWNMDYTACQMFPNNNYAQYPVDFVPVSQSSIGQQKNLTKPTQVVEEFVDEPVANSPLQRQVQVSEQKWCTIKLKQKYGRNISSNIFNTMVKRFENDPEFSHLVVKLMKRNKMKLKLSEFHDILAQKEANLKNYINIKKIHEFCLGPQVKNSEELAKNYKEIQFSKIFRIISRIYLKNHHVIQIYNSSKIKNKSKRLHLREIRRMLTWMT